MGKNSKIVAARVAVTETVTSSIQVHGPEVAIGLLKALPDSPRRPKIDMEELLDRLEQLLHQVGEELAAADQAHATELSDDEAPRLARDEQVVQVRDKLLGMRELLSGVFGEETVSEYHLNEAIPELPQQLLLRCRNVEKLLRKKPFAAASRLTSVKLKASDLADDLKALGDKLDRALSAVRTEEREAQATLEGKNRASEEWQRVYQGVTHMTYGAYILAGRPDLAERIEPTVRKRSGIEENPAPSPTNTLAPLDAPTPAPSP